MSEPIISFQDWLQTPPGHYLLEWERQQVSSAVTDIFGYHAIQLGVPELDGLQANRMPHRWLAEQSSDTQAPGQPAFVSDFCALPFPANCLDLVIMPHTLECSLDAHETLREVERVLVAEGRVVICGINPLSFWALRQARTSLWMRLGLGRFLGQSYLPETQEFIGYWRLRDWLRLLGFEIEVVRFGGYSLAVRTAKWLKRFAWMERWGARWWPIFGAMYMVVAVKKVRGLRLMGPAWKAKKVRAGNPVSASRQAQDATRRETDA